MCIRDRIKPTDVVHFGGQKLSTEQKRYVLMNKPKDTITTCLLYTSDAADERSSVDLGGRRIIKKKNKGVESSNTTSQVTRTEQSGTIETDSGQEI